MVSGVWTNSVDCGLYFNGNYCVTYHSPILRIKRALRMGEELKADYPDSIDLKITNKCYTGCPYCHENSCPTGKEFDLVETMKVLSMLPKVGIEVAIGGGNVLTCPDKAVDLIGWLIARGNIPAVTLNVKDLLNAVRGPKDSPEMKLLAIIAAARINLGISLDKELTTREEADLSYYLHPSSSVIHVVLGIIPPKDFKRILTAYLTYSNVLILGFKQFGRASGMNPLTDELLNQYREILIGILCSTNRNRISTIGFDNLAIEQLDIRSLFSESFWNRYYLGKEFSHSMYVDAVERTFAPTSRSEERVSWDDTDIISYFKNNHI